MQIDIKFDQAQLRRLLLEFAAAPATINRMLARAVNKTAKTGVSRATKRIASVTGYRQADVRKSIKLIPANYSKPEAKITITGKRLPLVAPKQTKAGVTAKGAKQTRYLLARAFIATMRSGHTGVFRRVGYPGELSPRLPIEELKGLAMSEAYEQADTTVAEELNELGDILEKNLESQFDLEEARAKARAA